MEVLGVIRRLQVLTLGTIFSLGFILCGTQPISATTLGNLASSMQPGTWAVLNTAGDASGFSQALLDSGNGHHILEYADKATWDPTSKQVLYIGQGHYEIQKFITYNEATNTWTVQPKPFWDCSASGGGCIGHGFQHNAINPNGREFYYRQYGSTKFFKYNIDSKSWNAISNSSLDNLVQYVQVSGGVEYFPAPVNKLIFVNGELNSTANIYSSDGSSWSRVGATGQYAVGNYSTIAVYNPVAQSMLIGGGNVNPRKLYKINNALQVTPLGNAPINIDVSTSIVTVDPVSGDYLVFANGGQFYKYNITSDSWIQLNAGSVPFLVGGSVFGVVAAPINSHGVVMFIQYNFGNSKVFLYKHSTTASSLTSPPPPPISSPSPSPTGGTDFQSKCQQPGVINCFGVDSTNQLYYNWQPGSACDVVLGNHPNGNNPFGLSRSGNGNAVATIQNGQCIYPDIDTSIRHSGTGALKFTIPPFSSADTSGYYSEPFKRLGNGSFLYIGPGSPSGSVLYFQFYQMFDPNFVSTNFQCTGGECGGWKQMIWYGNPPFGSSSSTIEVTHNNGWQRGVPQMYGQQGHDDYGIQDAAGCPYAGSGFSSRSSYPEPPCVQYKANQWMEFTGRIEVRGASNAPTSRVQLWVNGKLIIDYGQAKICWDNAQCGDGNGLGSFMVTPYHTNKNSAQNHPTGFTWVDDIIVSTQPIAMTGGGGSTNLPPAAPTNLRVQ